MKRQLENLRSRLHPRLAHHNRGCAVDLSLYALATGKPVWMVGVYDDMSERCYAGYPGRTSQRWRRELLPHAMEEEGFEVYQFEWWHFDYKDWCHYSILNLIFENISPAPHAPATRWPRVAPPISDPLPKLGVILPSMNEGPRGWKRTDGQ